MSARISRARSRPPGRLRPLPGRPASAVSAPWGPPPRIHGPGHAQEQGRRTRAREQDQAQTQGCGEGAVGPEHGVGHPLGGPPPAPRLCPASPALQPDPPPPPGPRLTPVGEGYCQPQNGNPNPETGPIHPPGQYDPHGNFFKISVPGK
jgi:hypothetical protein